MKKILILLSVALLPLLSGCEDFFNTKPEDIIDNDDYIAAQNEIYTGFYGIISKMQAMADHAIYLTDTRGHYLETTISTPPELEAVYKYGDLTGNSYADPSCYYALIIACNDYMHKMAEYKLKVKGALGTAEEDWKALISSAIRIKTWTYMRLAQIYGKAVWFSDPMVEMKDLQGSEFEHLNDVYSVIAKCQALLEGGESGIEGLEGINGQLTMDWEGYFDPEGSSTSFKYWRYITPDPLLLTCELSLWSGNPDYDMIRNRILDYLNPRFSVGGQSIPFLLNANYNSNYGRGQAFANMAHFYEHETVSSVMYNYVQKQVNRLAEHFSTTYPNQYYLRPASYGTQLFKEGDHRLNYSCYVMNDTTMGKYMYAVSDYRAYQSEASIPMQRGHDYHFYLSEAENHVGNWDEAETILNQGFTSRWSAGIDTSGVIDLRYNGWPEYIVIGNLNHNFGNQGIAGFHGGKQHPHGRIDKENNVIYVSAPASTNGAREDILAQSEEGQQVIAYLTENNVPYSLSDEPQEDQRIILPNEEARIKFFDLQLLDEMLLEYVGEGRTYGMMIRMALKYNDPAIIANRVCPKYPAGLRDDIRAKIMAGEYFVKWDL